jgi:PIN domain nuclease of toxin-antitoxin system
VRERYLLDSNVLLWLNLDPSRIPGAVIGDLDAADEVYFSAASAWELAIKQSLGKLHMTGTISAFVAKAGLLEIAVTTRFAEAAALLPMHHRDPFDRIIVAQAMEEGLTLITADRRLASYGIKILRV